MIALLALAAAQEAPPPPGPALPAPAVAAPEVAPAETAVSAAIVVAVPQPEAATEAIVAQAEALGGWFQSRSPGAVSLRVPSGAAEALLAACAGEGKVLDRSLAREDLSREADLLRGRLEARRQLIHQYEAVLATASPKSVVAVENSILGEIRQIEALEGRLRVIGDRARFARVDVSFRFQDRAAPTRDGRSSFGWIGSLNFQDVVRGLQSGRSDWTTGPEAATPAGFSAWRREGRFRAASPDGVLYRVRTVRHKPPADLAFWKEAVRGRMEAAGYRVVAEGDVTAGGVAGATLELVAANGTEDWTYLVAFFPNGRTLTIAEATGEVLAFDARRDAVTAAVAALAF